MTWRKVVVLIPWVMTSWVTMKYSALQLDESDVNREDEGLVESELMTRKTKIGNWLCPKLKRGPLKRQISHVFRRLLKR
jgi:hypothetical protein